ncbi:MAG: ABC transporter permease [Candidatus Uhrbacteria bacterium]
MKISDLFEETFLALVSNKARSGLTMLGIVIGISSVIAMVAIGQGTQSSIQSSIESIGSNLVQIMPGAQRSFGGGVSSGRGSAQTLTLEDAEAITENISLAKTVAPEVSSRYQVTTKGANTNTSVVGVTAAYLEVRNVEVESGVFVSDKQSKSLTKVAVIGPTVRDDLFGEGSEALGQIIQINGIQFTIIGVTKEKGGSAFGSQDDMIFIPLGTAQKYLTGNDYVTTISVQGSDSDSMDALQTAITNLLLEQHNISDAALADFNIMNQADIVETASSITGTLTALLAAVAGISLLVGGIGIMNMMLTTVTERTKEIGLRKAIGAKRRDINRQFLAEAVLLTLISGIIGIVLGIGVSFALSALGIIQTTISVYSILLAFGVSAIIGIIFGYYPARRAASLNPIVALRYE